MSGKEQRIRKSVDLGLTTADALERDRVLTDRVTDSETIRDALIYWDTLVTAAERGERVFIGTERDVAVEIYSPQLSIAARYGRSRR